MVVDLVTRFKIDHVDEPCDADQSLRGFFQNASHSDSLLKSECDRHRPTSTPLPAGTMEYTKHQTRNTEHGTSCMGPRTTDVAVIC